MKYTLLVAALVFSVGAFSAETGPLTDKQPPKPGAPAVQVPIDTLKPSHVFDIGGVPDWMVITKDSVWLANRPQKKVRRIDPVTNTIVAEIEFPNSPCSGINTAFGAAACRQTGSAPQTRLRPPRTSASSKATTAVANSPASGRPRRAGADYVRRAPRARVPDLPRAARARVTGCHYRHAGAV